MSPTHVEEMLTVVFGAPGFFLLLWAIVNRQFRGSEKANLEVNETDDLPHGAGGAKVSRRKARLASTVIVLVFFLISVCPVVLTLVMVYRGLSAERAQMSTAARHR